MKTIINYAAAFCLFASISQGAITISGTVGTSFKGDDNITNIPVGSLWMVIADTTSGVDATSNGFLGGSISPSLNALTTTSDPSITAANASITLGGYFGGDRIIGTGATTSAGVIGSMLTSASIAGFTSKSFALIWFEDTSANLGVDINGAKYGIIRGADWVLPSSDAGTFTMSSTDAVPADNYYSFSASATAAQFGATGFFTGSGTAGSNAVRGATFSVVPEPSVALLGAIGVLGLLRRRRN